MRELSLGAGASLGLLLAISQLGCNWLLDIDKEYTIAQEPGPYGATAASTGTGLPPGCIPSENSGPVGDGCGVFVALDGDDGGDGSKSNPVKTLKKAIELAKGNGNTVYACAGSFNEAVELPGGVSLFGGLDCKEDWGYGGETKRTVIAPVVAANPPPMADVIPLKVLGKGNTRIENVDVRAPDAVLPGGSSIAVIVENTTAEIVNCSLTAGAGKDGDKGATPTTNVGLTDPAQADDPAIKGEDGVAACMDSPTGSLGGATKTNMLCATSAGGAGGTGLPDKGENGVDGTPSGAAGKGGIGQPTTGTWSCVTGAGQIGENGVDGTFGAGAAGTGTIDVTGYVGAAGGPGTGGAPGQGGGGGGGAKGKTGCNGASGGGGGAGGCGGGGGEGGKAGGSSIGLISLNAQLTITKVKVTTGKGGAGGEGGDGQIGGIGGLGGSGGASTTGVVKACTGGEGGSGGSGGKGGGGRGGHSIGIASKGKAPVNEDVAFTLGEAGGGGLGGDMAGNGAAGEKSQSFTFKD